MGKLWASILILLALAVPLASHGAPQDQAKSELSGHYYLQGRSSEVGSELLLKKDGKFEWALMYGAVDMVAQGVWQQTGEQVLLTFDTQPEPVFRMMPEKDYAGAEPVEPGRWNALTGVLHVGALDGIEVRFEARSGKSVTAVTERGGNAIVSMPDTEVWTRAGLRREGSKEPWQWFAIPPERAKARLVAFLATNITSVQQAPFSTLQLHLAPEGLVIDDNANRLRGTYVKQ